MSVKITFSGKWNSAIRRMLSGGVVRVDDKALLVLGRAVEEQIKKRMREYPPNLKASTKEKKRKLGARQPARAWFDTGWIAASGILPPKVTRTSKGAKVFVQISNKPHPTAGIPTSVVFFMVENGTSKQRPRPVLDPVFKDLENGRLPALKEYMSRVRSSVKF